MRRRINITLPGETLRRLDRIADKGSRSWVIAEAVERYVAEVGRKNLRKQVREGGRERAERDLRIAEEWLRLDDATWPRDEG